MRRRNPNRLLQQPVPLPRVQGQDKGFKIVDAELGVYLAIGATINAEQVEYTDSHATYRIDLSILGRPSRTCLLECDIRGTTLHMSEIQMRPDKTPEELGILSPASNSQQ